MWSWEGDSDWTPMSKGKGKGWSKGGVTGVKGSSLKGASKGWGGGGWGGGWGGGEEDMVSLLWNLLQQKGGKGKGGKGWSSSGKFKVDDSGGVLGEFTGTIRNFNDWKCYGFIDCPDLAAQGHESVFLHGDMKKGYRVGHTVKFTAFLTAEGKCQAKDLKSGLK
mmetsp:Transcript_88310/g.254779  ORF Transcript_88310/g.254779 Transcript_88310/m.254779 type:complete len:164 (+) Transcript_88310:72-563(+)